MNNTTATTIFPSNISRTLCKDEKTQKGSSSFHVLVTLAIFIVLSNTYIIAKYKRWSRTKKTTSSFLLCIQAVADLSIGLVFVPAFIVDGFYMTGVSGYVNCFIFLNSLSCRWLLAVDRFLSVMRPLRYRSLMFKGRLQWISIKLTLASLLFALIPLIWVVRSQQQRQIINQYFKVVLWCTIMILLLSLFGLYLVTFYTARRCIRRTLSNVRQCPIWQMERLRSFRELYNRKEQKLSYQFAIQACIFGLTYLPILYINLVGPILGRLDLIPGPLLTVSLYTFTLNALLSAIFSVSFNDKLRPRITYFGQDAGGFHHRNKKSSTSSSKELATSPRTLRITVEEI